MPVELSVAVTVKLNVPPAVGVPVRDPLEDKLSPAGSVPAVTAKVCGAVPPVAVMDCEYADPTVPAGSDAGLTVIVGALIVSV